MSDAINLQEAILKEVRRDKVPVTLFLMNGFQLRGIITGYDSFVVVLVSDGKQQMIYKHAISHPRPHETAEGRSRNCVTQKGQRSISLPLPFFQCKLRFPI